MEKLLRFRSQAKQLRKQEQENPDSVQMSEVLKLIHFTLNQLVQMQSGDGVDETGEMELEEGRTGEQQGMFISVETYRQTMYTLRLLAPHHDLAVGMFVRLLAEAEGKTIERATEEVRQSGIFAHLRSAPAVDVEFIEPVVIQESLENEAVETTDESEENESESTCEVPVLGVEEEEVESPSEEGGHE